MTRKTLLDIQSQLDATVPYYLPQLVQDHLDLLEAHEKLIEDFQSFHNDMDAFKGYLQAKLPALVQEISVTVAMAIREGWTEQKLIDALDTLHLSLKSQKVVVQ